MEKHYLTEKILTVTKELNELVERIKETNNFSVIDIDLSLEKLREIYETLHRFKTSNFNTRKSGEITEHIDNTDKDSENNKITEEITDTTTVTDTINNFDNKETKEQDIVKTENNLPEETTENKTSFEIDQPEKSQTNVSQISLFDNNDVENTTKEGTDSLIQENTTTHADKEVVEKIPEAAEKQTTIAEDFVTDKKTINDIFADFKKTKDLATQLQYQPINNLKSVITLNDKIRFIKELFDSSSEKYALSIEKLDSFDNLDQAMEYLNNNFEWDDTKDSFKDFLELVYRRFLPVL